MKLKKLILTGLLIFSAAMIFAQGKLNWYVCTGSYGIEGNAVKFKAELEKAGYSAFIEPAFSKEGKRLYRVCLAENFDSINDARDFRDKFSLSDFAAKKGLSGIWICNAPNHDSEPKEKYNESQKNDSEPEKNARVVESDAKKNLDGVSACLEKIPCTDVFPLNGFGVISFENMKNKIAADKVNGDDFSIDFFDMGYDEEVFGDPDDLKAFSVVLFADEDIEKGVAVSASCSKKGEVKEDSYAEGMTVAAANLKGSILDYPKTKEILSVLPEISSDDFFYFILTHEDYELDQWNVIYCFGKEGSVVEINLFDLGKEFDTAKKTMAEASEKLGDTVKVKDTDAWYINDEKSLIFFTNEYMFMVKGLDKDSTQETLKAVAEGLNIW